MNPDTPKSALREALRRHRRALRESAPDAAVQAAEAFVRQGFSAFRNAAVYHPQGSELDPFPLAAVLRRAGTEILLPVVEAPDRPLIFRVLTECAPLAPDAAGVPSPTASAPARRPDLLVVPLLGFDAEGGRLGQGGGYYDRTLEQLRAGPEPAPFVLGLAYAGQAVDNLPREPHDQRLDAVLTEAGLLRFDHRD